MGNFDKNTNSFKLLFESPPVSITDLCSPRYIERFRHGPPQSREERQHIDSAPREKHHPFWWMSVSSLPPSSTPTKATKTGTFLLTMSELVFFLCGVLLAAPKFPFCVNSLMCSLYARRNPPAFEGRSWTYHIQPRWTFSALQISFPLQRIRYCECICKNIRLNIFFPCLG